MTTTATFENLIGRFGADIAYLASYHLDDPTGLPAEGITPEQFTRLVGEAADNTSTYAPYQDWAEELELAARYLGDALSSDPDNQGVFLAKAAGSIDVAAIAAEDLRLSR
ncbi:hypothetical protein ACFYNO_33070 [Kitasatospora sp. NPDC006697]|uniref:hypothetical protein n=1 Tax=Kitasatospora sp. NPDC006697 TaxID=3364020 RepID=UPI00368B2D62